MIRKIWGIGFVILPFLFNITQGCIQENISCNRIKTEGAFQFPHGCPEKSEVVVSNYQNITIAIRKVGTQTFQISDKVFKADDQSIVTRDCQYLKVGCTVYEGDHIKQEICRAFTVTEKLKNPDPPIPWGIIRCLERNTPCNNIKTSGGFQFPYDCPLGSEVLVSVNQTQIADGKVGDQAYRIGDKVLTMDNHSIVTRDCENLTVKCIVPKGDQITGEICWAFTITEEPKNPDSSTPWGLIIGVFGVVLFIVIVIWFSSSYISWKKRQPSAATLPKFLRYLWSCSCLKTENAEREETQETGCPQENGVPQVIAGNGVIRMGEISASQPHGSDQNDINTDDTPESVKVDSIDPNADGKTPQPFSLDHNLTNGAIQTTKNGDISAPDANRASYDRTMNRSLRDDPGGINNNKGEDAVRTRERPSGWALGNRGPEDGVDEEKALLSDQGATIQDSDMTGEAAALVNKRGSDPGQDGRCSTAPVTYEKSLLDMKNYKKDIN